MRNEKVEKIVEFLNDTEKNLKELEDSKEYLKTLEEAVEDAYDLDEDDTEREDAKDNAEREHSQCFDNIEYLEKEISENFTLEVAKELVPFVKKLLKYSTSIQHRLDSIAYDARELSDENELDDDFYQANNQLNEQKVSQ